MVLLINLPCVSQKQHWSHIQESSMELVTLVGWRCLWETHPWLTKGSLLVKIDWRCCHIYCCSVKLCVRNPVIPVVWLIFMLVTWIRCVEQEKPACFESDFWVSCTFYISTLLRRDSGTAFLCMQNFAAISVMWLHPKKAWLGHQHAISRTSIQNTT